MQGWISLLIAFFYAIPATITALVAWRRAKAQLNDLHTSVEHLTLITHSSLVRALERNVELERLLIKELAESEPHEVDPP